MESAAVDFDGLLGPAPEGGLTVLGQDARIGGARADTVAATPGVRRQHDPGREPARGPRRLAARTAGRVERAGEAWAVTIDRASWDVGEALALETEGPLRLRLEPGGRVVVERAHILSNAGSVAAPGTWGGKNAPSDLLLDLETLDLESMLGAFLPEANARGIVTGRARVEGMGKDLVYTVDLEGRELRWRRLGARRLVARGRFAQDAWQVERLDLDTGRGRLGFTGRLDVGPPAGLRRRRGRVESRARRGSPLARRAGGRQPGHGPDRRVVPRGRRLARRPRPGVHARRASRRAGGAGHRAPSGGPGWGQATLDDFKLDVEYRDELVDGASFRHGRAGQPRAVAHREPCRCGWVGASTPRIACPTARCRCWRSRAGSTCRWCRSCCRRSPRPAGASTSTRA